MTLSVDQLLSSALKLPRESRAALAGMLITSLDESSALPDSDSKDIDIDEFARRLTAHFHEAKKTALSQPPALPVQPAAMTGSCP